MIPCPKCSHPQPYRCAYILQRAFLTLMQRHAAAQLPTDPYLDLHARMAASDIERCPHHAAAARDAALPVQYTRGRNKLFKS